MKIMAYVAPSTIRIEETEEIGEDSVDKAVFSAVAEPPTIAETLLAPPLNSSRDNLQCLEGIGPVTEMMLNNVGVRRYGDFEKYTPEHLAQMLFEKEGVVFTAAAIARWTWLGRARLLDGQN